MGLLAISPEAGVLDTVTSATLWYDVVQERPQPGSPLSLWCPELLWGSVASCPCAGLQPPSLRDVQTDSFVPHFLQQPELM